MLIQPQNTVTEIIARISLRGDVLCCSFKARNNAFRQAVKSLGLRWSEADWLWRRKISSLAGSPADRAAELAASLINAGITCEVSPDIGNLVQTAGWQPEQKRWVRASPQGLHISWRGDDENLYRRALTLPEARWDHETKSILVPALYADEVAGFADEHEFALSDGAKSALALARHSYARLILPAAPLPDLPKKTKRKKTAVDPARFADIPSRQVVTTTTLYPYQAVGVEKLLPSRLGALFMDMGTGKTRCAIELVARRQQRISRVVWFTPVSLKLTIAEEIAKHTAGEPVYIFDDSTTCSNLPDSFWYIVGIESMSSSDRVVLAVDKLIDADTMVIVDESSYIKGHAAMRTMRITELSRRSRYRLLLTGTPLSQGIEDLYAQMRFLSPDILGYNSFYSFARNHLEYSEIHQGMILRATGMENLTQKITPYIYQVQKSECMELPEKLYDQVYFSLSDAQYDAYEEAKSEILLNKDIEDITSYTIFQLFTALQQIVSGFRVVDGETIEYPNQRLDALQTALDSIPPGEKVIIWTKFIYSLKQISSRLPGSALYYGDLSEKDRQIEINRFRNDSDCLYLVATQATGGHGLTINEAHYHVFYENEFKYSHRIQAEDRSHRIGQTQPVTYVDLYSDSGIDTRIRKALAKKQDVVRSFRAEIQKNREIRV